MEIKNVITVDNLTENSVSVKTQKIIDMDGTSYPMGDPHRCAYMNSTSGRASLKNDVPEPYLSAVLNVWGDAPTVEDVKSQITPETEESESEE